MSGTDIESIIPSYNGAAVISLDVFPLESRKSAAAPENMIRYPSQTKMNSKMNQEICNFWPLKATDMGEWGQK